MKIMNYLFPNAECAYCGLAIYDDKYLCPSCEKRLEEFRRADCVSGNTVKGHILYYYEDLVKDMMMQFKYHDKRFYAKMFGRLMSNKINEMGIDFDVVIPIPSNWRRKSSRGYNQAALLAKQVSDLCGIPYDSKYLKRVDNTDPLNRMQPNERVDQLKSAFEVRGNQIYDRVLLIDDIYTTGTTVESCGKLLYEYESSQIIFIAFSGNY